MGVLSDLSPALLQDDNGMVIGAEVKDHLSGKKRNVYAKQVVNATGPFTDGLRQMSDPSKPSIIMPSAGMSALPHCSACTFDEFHQATMHLIHASWFKCCWR